MRQHARTLNDSGGGQKSNAHAISPHVPSVQPIAAASTTHVGPFCRFLLSPAGESIWQLVKTLTTRQHKEAARAQEAAAAVQRCTGGQPLATRVNWCPAGYVVTIAVNEPTYNPQQHASSTQEAANPFTGFGVFVDVSCDGAFITCSVQGARIQAVFVALHLPVSCSLWTPTSAHELDLGSLNYMSNDSTQSTTGTT